MNENNIDNSKLSKIKIIMNFIKKSWYQIIMIGLMITLIQLAMDIDGHIRYSDSDYYDGLILKELENINQQLKYR